MDGIGRDVSPVFTGLSAHSCTHRRCLLKAPGFRPRRRAPGPDTAAASTAAQAQRSRQSDGTAPRAERPGRAEPPQTSCQIRGYARISSHASYGFPGSRLSENALRGSLLPQLVGSVPESRHRKSQKGQNPQLSANCPFLRILAQSQITKLLIPSGLGPTPASETNAAPVECFVLLRTW